MTLIRSRSSWALCALALWFPSTSLMASDDGGPAQDVGIVHASGDEAWIDLPASLNDTWKATLAELKERGHLDDAELSYVESNGQIALETLWVAVVPGASLGAPISRVRIVVLVGADELERRTAALVGAGALLGAIAERLPARGPIPSPFVGPAPAGEAEPATEAAGVRDDLVTSYDTYNTYNTYNTYDGYAEHAYVDYVPVGVYVWQPWWWNVGWCHDDWWFGWGSSSWGWGWNSGWWGWPGWSWNLWWWDCDDDWDDDCDDDFDGDSFDSPGTTDTTGRTGLGADAIVPTSSTSIRPTTVDPLEGVTRSGALETVGGLDERSPRDSGRQSSGRLASVDAFPPREAPSAGRGASKTNSRSNRWTIVSTHTSAGGRAKPGSVTKLKAVSPPNRLGSIHDSNSLALASGGADKGASSRSNTGGKRASTPFTIRAGETGGEARSSPSATSSSSFTIRDSGPQAAAPRSSPSSSSSSSRPSTSIRSTAPSTPSSASRSSAPSSRSSGPSRASSSGSSSSGRSLGGGGSGGGSSGGSSSSGGHGGGRSGGGGGRGPR